MDTQLSNSGLASTPKAAFVPRKASFATPRSAVAHNGVPIAAGSVAYELLVSVTYCREVMTSKHEMQIFSCMGIQFSTKIISCYCYMCILKIITLDSTVLFSYTIGKLTLPFRCNFDGML
jgi:hypothetical protein